MGFRRISRALPTPVTVAVERRVEVFRRPSGAPVVGRRGRVRAVPSGETATGGEDNATVVPFVTAGVRVDHRFGEAKGVRGAVGHRGHFDGFVVGERRFVRFVRFATVPVDDFFVPEVRVAEVRDVAGTTVAPTFGVRFADRFRFARALVRRNQRGAVFVVARVVVFRLTVQFGRVGVVIVAFAGAGEGETAVKRGLFDERKRAPVPRDAVGVAVVASRVAEEHPHRKRVLVLVGVGLASQRQLFQVVRALHTTGRFARRLNGRQEQTDQNPDNRDDDQQFDESKTVLFTPPPQFNIRFHF